MAVLLLPVVVVAERTVADGRVAVSRCVVNEREEPMAVLSPPVVLL